MPEFLLCSISFDVTPTGSKEVLLLSAGSGTFILHIVCVAGGGEEEGALFLDSSYNYLTNRAWHNRPPCVIKHIIPHAY